MKLVTFSEAILSGKPFRHYTMARLDWVWFKVHSNTEIHILGPDDIVPLDEAIPLEWRIGAIFELKDDA
jgi:hypothetical protein